MATVAGYLRFHLILAHRPRGLHVPEYLKVGLGREFCVMHDLAISCGKMALAR